MGILDDLTQVGRPLQAKTALADDVLIPTRLVGMEALSRPFQFTVDFVAPLATVTAAQILGKPVALTLDAEGDQERFVHGLVSRWSQTGRVGVGTLSARTYRAELVPWLWMLGLSTDCRTFENQTVQQVVEAVFRAAGFADFRWRLSGGTPTLAYVVQYQETDLAFVSRLLEEHGLYYAFEYEASKHRLVISDSVGVGIPAGALASLKYVRYTQPLAPGQAVPGLPGLAVPNIPGLPPGTNLGNAGATGGKALGGIVGSLLGPLGSAAGGALGGMLGGWLDDFLGEWFGGLGKPPADALTEYLREQVVHTKGTAARDFHLLRAADAAQQASADPGASGERYAFLGDLAGTPAAGDTTDTTKRRIEAEEAGYDVVRGSSTAHHLTPGTRVTLEGLPADPDNVSVHLTAVAHVFETGGLLGADRAVAKYFNEFTGIPSATPYRPERVTPRPSVRGTQTALVVGAGNAGDIDVDQHGCVLLQFPWDRGAGKDAGSTHRVHVASYWAGTSWGAVHLPRKGQLVLTEFLEGDPDRPIVTGRVYSSDLKPPYALPDNKTQSGVKSRTVGGGTDNFNELRFEDKKGEEHVFLQAEKDLTAKVKHDETRTVGHDRKATVQHHDHHFVVGGDGDKLGEQKLRVEQGNQYVIAVKGDQQFNAIEGTQVVAVVKGTQYVRIDEGDQYLAVKKGDRYVDVEQGNNTATISGTDATSADTITLTAQTKIEAKVGSAKLTMTASKIELTVGGSSLVLDAASIKQASAQIEHKADGTLKTSAPMVTVEGSGMLKMAAPMLQASGDGLLKLAGGVIMAG